VLKDLVPYPLDDQLFHLLYARDHHSIALGAIALSFIGGGWGLAVIAPLAIVARTRAFALWLIGTLVGTAVVIAGLKVVVGRGRPCTVYPALAQAITDSPTDCSFPSGHAAGSFCFALFVATALLARDPRPRWARGVALGCVAFATLVAASRVVLGFHFPSDVLGGALLGGAIGAFAGRKFAAQRIPVSPE
jgi:undecaprenyl-diphosphatase